MRNMFIASVLFFAFSFSGCSYPDNYQDWGASGVLHRDYIAHMVNQEAVRDARGGDWCKAYFSNPIRGLKLAEFGTANGSFVLVVYEPKEVDGEHECPRGAMFWMPWTEFRDSIRMSWLEKPEEMRRALKK